MAAIIWFYAWTVDPMAAVPPLVPASSDYYNLQVRGFLKGQTALDLPADPFLATLKNPYDPGQRQGHGLHDASYFAGRYHLYFGVSPALLLQLPVRLLTGKFVSEVWAVLTLASLGFLANVALLRTIIREAFPATGRFLRLAVIPVAGLITMVPAMIRRSAIWEVPITAAYACFMFTLLTAWLATGRRAPGWWAVVMGTAMGLCIGARPVYLLGAFVVLVPVAWRASRLGATFWRQVAWWRLVLAVVLPLTVVGAGLAIYNQVRFGNPAEFGQTYQMAGADDVGKLKLFSLGYLPFNLHLYLLSVPGLSPYFPFITVIDPPPAPPGQFGIEDPYGVIPAMPWVLLAGVAAVWAVRPRARLDWWCFGAGGAVLACLGMVGCFGGATNRYMVDFVPGLSVLGMIGALRLETLASRWRRLGLLVAGVLLIWSTAFGVLASMQHNRLLQVNYPAVYGRVALAFNRISAAVDWVTGAEYGPLELKVVFPRDRVGKLEPLVTTGVEFLSDYLYVLYLPDDQVRIGFEHTGYGGGAGPPIRVEPGVEHTVVVQMGSLYPPLAHPYFIGLDPEVAKARTRLVRVTIDGRPALSLVMECYDATDRHPDLGTSGGRPAFQGQFTGRILAQRRLAPPQFSVAGARPGPMHLSVRFPAFRGRRHEPLLSMGESGRGDLIYVVYVDEKHIAFGHDKWSFGGTTSEPIEIVPGASYQLTISCPPLRGNAGPPGLEVWLDGRPVVANTDSFHPSTPDSFTIGANRIGASTAEPVFTGDLVLAETPSP